MENYWYICNIDIFRHFHLHVYKLYCCCHKCLWQGDHTCLSLFILYLCITVASTLLTSKGSSVTFLLPLESLSSLIISSYFFTITPSVVLAMLIRLIATCAIPNLKCQGHCFYQIVSLPFSFIAGMVTEDESKVRNNKAWNIGQCSQGSNQLIGDRHLVFVMCSFCSHGYKCEIALYNHVISINFLSCKNTEK